MNKQRLVEEFMLKTGRQSIPSVPSIPDEATRQLRVKLILEEAQEFLDSSESEDIIGVADALADLLYVVYGAASAYGIKIDPIFMAVHLANMEKFGEGSYERADGKWMKSPDWKAPDIKSLLVAQGLSDAP